jgi:hypothetical protein
MIISNSKRFVFVHVPKTGGSSVTSALLEGAQWNDIVLGATPLGEKISPLYRQQFGLWKHSSAREIRSVVGDRVWIDYFTFGFVRNPYQRMRSLYTFARSSVERRGGRRYARFLFKKDGFWTWDYVRAFLETPRFADFIRNPLLLNSQVALPFTDYLMEDGEIIVDYVGKLECLENDIAKICAKANLPRRAIETVNSSEASSMLDQYYRNQSDYDFIYDRYKSDFVTFGYSQLKA